MQSKILSISIASYNTERFIEETVRSLFVDEEYIAKIEIIIVNDGSTDQTSKMAHELAKEFPDSIVVIDKENGGYGSTINASLAIANGKYYKLLDGDDWYDTDNLKDFIAYLEDIDSDIVISPYYEMRGGKKIVDAHKEISEQEISFEELHINNYSFAMHEIAIKTDRLRDFHTTITENCFYTDMEYVFYSFCVSRTISRFSKPVYCYRLDVDGQSVSINGIKKHFQDYPIVADTIMSSHQKEIKKIEDCRKEILNQIVERITYNMFQAYAIVDDYYKWKTEIKKINQTIKNKYPLSYVIGNRSKTVKLTRILNFSFYRMTRHIMMNRLKSIC